MNTLNAVNTVNTVFTYHASHSLKLRASSFRDQVSLVTLSVTRQHVHSHALCMCREKREQVFSSHQSLFARPKEHGKHSCLIDSAKNAGEHLSMLPLTFCTRSHNNYQRSDKSSHRISHKSHDKSSHQNSGPVSSRSLLFLVTVLHLVDMPVPVRHSMPRIFRERERER